MLGVGVSQGDKEWPTLVTPNPKYQNIPGLESKFKSYLIKVLEDFIEWLRANNEPGSHETKARNLRVEQNNLYPSDTVKRPDGFRTMKEFQNQLLDQLALKSRVPVAKRHRTIRHRAPRLDEQKMGGSTESKGTF